MKEQNWHAYYLIPVFIIIDALTTFLAISSGYATELNPFTRGIAGTPGHAIMMITTAIITARMIHLDIKTRMTHINPKIYDVLLFIEAVNCVLNSLGMFASTILLAL